MLTVARRVQDAGQFRGSISRGSNLVKPAPNELATLQIKEFPHRRDVEMAVLSLRAEINCEVRSPDTVIRSPKPPMRRTTTGCSRVHKRSAKKRFGRMLFSKGKFYRRRKQQRSRRRSGWHTFRRTTASLLLSTGANIRPAQELMRHASPVMTLGTYAQAITEEKGRCSRTPKGYWTVSVRLRVLTALVVV
jgi:hypothetical protein